MGKLMVVACFFFFFFRAAALFIEWLFSGLCWQLLNCSHLLCFALKPNKSPNRICWHSHKAPCHSADWYGGNGCVFLRFAVCRVYALVCYWITWSIAIWLTHHQLHNSQCINLFVVWSGLNWNVSQLFVSLCAVSGSHQSAVANSEEIQYNVFFSSSFLAASWMLFTVALHYSNGLLFWRQKQQSLFHCMESWLQAPATTWQLKTAHYKKTENPCLMFLLSEGGTAISSYPSQAFPL